MEGYMSMVEAEISLLNTSMKKDTQRFDTYKNNTNQRFEQFNMQLGNLVTCV